jgi:hypothetical protein
MYAQWRSIDDYQAMRQDPAPLLLSKVWSRHFGFNNDPLFGQVEVDP